MKSYRLLNTTWEMWQLWNPPGSWSWPLTFTSKERYGIAIEAKRYHCCSAALVSDLSQGLCSVWSDGTGINWALGIVVVLIQRKRLISWCMKCFSLWSSHWIPELQNEIHLLVRLHFPLYHFGKWSLQPFHTSIQALGRTSLSSTVGRQWSHFA